jgi:tetratricopeptide (TPR) repeat protein
MNEANQNIKLVARIDELQARLKAPGYNYFTLLGLTLTATQKEIEAAYRQLSEELSSARLASLGQNEAARRGQAIAKQLQRAFQVLSDYNKRGEYEKRGYKEFIPPDAKEDTVEFAKTLYRKALTLFNQGNFQKTIIAIEEAIRQNPSKAEYYLLLGLCQSEFPPMKRQAEQNLLKAVEIEPWNAVHVAALGMLFYSVGLRKRAEVYFRKTLELEPNHDLARKKLAEITGPEKKFSDQMKEKGEKLLKKVLPSLFNREKH